MTWSLVDVEERALASPNTFLIPDLADRLSVERGYFVKLVFHADGDSVIEETPDGFAGERMWVRVTSVLSLSRGYRGVLDNRPAFIKGLAKGSEITFGPEHIADIEAPS